MSGSEGRKYFTYMVRCGDGSLYTGFTVDDLEKRIETHNAGKGGRYTRSRLPVKLVWYRTEAKQIQSNLLPYIVEVIAADKPGILFQLADFFDHQGITIESLHCSRYRAMQTGADMFSAQLTIGVPADMHIAALRDDFLEFCDHLNLDAIMDPMKY